MSESKTTPDLSIVIPAYREEKRIGTTLERLASYLKTTKALAELTTEVIVVAADAPDQTKEVAESKASLFANFQLITPGPRVGKGRDVKAGMQAARGSAALFMDADLATPLHHIEEFYDRFKQGSAIVIATRSVSRPGNEAVRAIISTVGNVIYGIAGGVWLEDSQCGFKLFSKEASQVCFSKLKLTDWGFDMELLTIAKANHFKLTTVHISDWVAVPGGSFEDSIMRNSIHALGDQALILFRRLKGSYKTTEPKKTTAA